MQTSYEAVEALMRGRQAEFVPLFDSPWGDTLRRWVSEGMPADAKGNAIDTTDHFGFDTVGAGGWFNWQANLNPPGIIEETNDWKIVRNGNGAALKWWKNRSGTPEHMDFHMSSRRIWEEEYKPHLLEDHRPRLGDLEGTRKALKHRKDQGKWVFFGHMFIWEILRASLGDVNMFMTLIEDPDWIHDFNRTYTDLYKTCWKTIFAEGGVPDGIWIYEDLGYRDRLFCSPDTLRELIFPYYKEMVDFFHTYNLPVVLHSCGYQEPMIPLAVEAGFDAINPMEAKAGNDIFKYAEVYGDRLCFVGGLDARILESGDRATIRAGITRHINGLRERNARFIYGSDHSLSTLISYPDFLYSLEVYRELRMR
ncbi:MAG: hypothetical protein A3K19_27895 [Lentisphaerae bacterium RIFOXYB12_FULL_65_16]|nr:MAG: hypothetical protein A3K18_25900 [Lentisphaerae bacterium RIFOXYA12_64_32]OGV88187.1 MAG: hypothetical protein A3K19_27895 [Lentisphaerae bacterium RIFOXYB12_FULL_65_16]